MGCKESKESNEMNVSFKNMSIFPVFSGNNFPTDKIEKPSPKAKENREPNTKYAKNKTTRINAPENSSLITDRRINVKYKIKAVIGKGSFSKVIRVEERISRQPYAIKMIESSKGGETFEAELTVLRRVSHQNVIKLVEVFDSNSVIYMVMELATGGSLLDRLEALGRYGEVESQYVLKMVLNGIAYLHKLGITHRDLKPDNLLYYHPGRDSKLLITDFGFASTRKPNGNPYMHTVCGTPQYAAPEIVCKHPYTSSVDMWAIGVITYIVLSGMFPFDAEHDSLVYKLIISGKYSFSDVIWQAVTEDGKNFIQQLLQNNPDKRLTAVQAGRHPWISSVRGCSPSRSNTLSTGSSRSSTPLRRSSSQQSSHSAWSNRSLRSAEHRRVQNHHLDALRNDPEFSAMVRPLNVLLSTGAR